MSRNKNRLTTGLPKESPKATASLDFAVPTEIVDLPSKGLFYPEGHPLHNKESAEIRFMTAKDEDTLTSPSLLRKGVALQRLLSDVLLDKDIDPQQLLPCDRSALLIATRVTGYGSNYSTEWVCPSCGHENDGEFDVTSHTTSLPREEELAELGVSADNGLYKFNIEGLSAEVAIRPLFHGEEAEIAESSERKAQLGVSESLTTDTLKACIVSINGVEDPRIINHVAEQMPVRDSRKIRKVHSLITPSLKLDGEVTCAKCSKTTRLEVPFTTGFFWPKL